MACNPRDYPDDGHIYVCVRVRDVPSGIGHLSEGRNSTNQTATRSSTRKAAQRAAQTVCVSTLENIVVMHDPNSVEDISAVTRDANNVVQLLTDRAAGRLSTRRTTGTGDSVSKRASARFALPFTPTANYYECDHCITSMNTADMLHMPIVKNSDFLQPPPKGSQEDVYRCTAFHAVKAAVEGINSCVFAYGQTGSGKTYTLFGDSSNIRKEPGIVPRALDDLFQQLEAIKLSYATNATTEYSYRVQLTFFEIYQNEVICLFSRKGPLHVQFVRDSTGKKETMVIHDLQYHAVTAAEKAYPLVEMGLRRRQTGETGMNARSSRSHAILQAHVTQYRTNRETKETVELNAAVNLVDLAGSERQRTAQTQGKSREEGILINQSLATLARVINDIARGATFVNYRDSLLTMVLKDNLGGNSKTFMIATISPCAFSYHESCATLTYAKDVRKIRNRPVVNKTFQSRANLLDQNAMLKRENERLKEQMEEWVRHLGNHHDDDGDDSVTEARRGVLTATVTDSSGQTPAVNSGRVGNEVTVAACSGGFVAPLLISSQRKFKSLAGIGGSSIEGGVTQVTSLNRAVMRFDLARWHGKGELATEANPKMLTAADKQQMDGADGTSSQMYPNGYIEVQRVAQRSCEQRYAARFVPPEDPQLRERIIDFQINGVQVGSALRELNHGDVLCIYAEDGSAGEQQSVVAFHFVDLNCLTRNVKNTTHATLGQLAVSVDLPDVEDMTTAQIQQLQRDYVKLLDMVQQQVNLGVMNPRSSLNSCLSSMSRVSPGFSPSPQRASPAIKTLDTGTHHHVAPVMEAFCREKVSPTIRGCSVLPGDIEEAALLHRASQQRESMANPSAGPRKVRTEHDAMREMLDKRLRDLESGKSLSRDKQLSVSPSSDGQLEPSPHGEESTPVSPSIEPYNTTFAPKECFSPREVEEDNVQDVVNNFEPGHDAATPPAKERMEVMGDGRIRIFYEGTGGLRERHLAVQRETEQYAHIAKLEDTIADLHGHISVLESRLRMAREALAEQQMLREGMDTENMTLEEKLLQLRRENATLTRDNGALEDIVQAQENALTIATTMGEAEMEQRLAVMSEQIKALCALARLWKRRAMKYIARGYGAGDEENDLRLEAIPWSELRQGATSDIVKKLLGGDANCSSDAADTVDVFELGTAQEMVMALESALMDFEKENQRLQNEVRRYEEALQELRDLVNRLQLEKDKLENDAANVGVTEEEEKKLKGLLDAKSAELDRAKRELQGTQQKLDDAIRNRTSNKERAGKKSSQLLQEQRTMMDNLRSEMDILRKGLADKDEELRGLLGYMQDHDMITEVNQDTQCNELRDRIEALIAEAMPGSTGAHTYSVFPSDFQFSDEVIALIRVCLRMLLDRLKIELYVLNRQNVHKFGLLVPSVQIRPESKFHSFMHELRGVAGALANRALRTGGKWPLDESDVLSGLIGHHRRRAGDALNGLLIWYDHWDLSPKSEHVCYMELIRNSERIMQMARLVRQESLVNTNATSTLLMPIPGKKGASDQSHMPLTARSKDTSVRESCKILKRLSSNNKRSNLAKAVEMASRPSSFPTATVPLSRTISAMPNLLEGTPFGRSATATAALRSDNASFHRRATACVLPVSENDINYAANTDVVQSESLITYNFTRRMSAAVLPDPLEGSVRRPQSKFSRCQTALPAPTRDTETRGYLAGTVKGSRAPASGATKKSVGFGRSMTAFTKVGTTPRRSVGSVGNVSHVESTRRSLTHVSPQPLVPTHSRASIHKNAKTGGEKPASFYDPKVMQALRERSTSDANLNMGNNSRKGNKVDAGSEKRAGAKGGAIGVKGSLSNAPAPPTPFRSTAMESRAFSSLPRRSLGRVSPVPSEAPTL